MLNQGVSEINCCLAEYYWKKQLDETILKYSQIIYCLQEKLTHFGLGVSVLYVIPNLYVLNCFKYFQIYILGKNVAKYKTRKFLKYLKSFCTELF